jgi:hypothetical protein
VLISFDRTEQPAQARFGCRVLHFRDHIRGAASRTDELAVEDTKIDLLVILDGRSSLGSARSQLILNNNLQKPTIAGMDRRYFQSRDRGDFSQVLAFLIAKMKLLLKRNVSRLNAAARLDPEA